MNSYIILGIIILFHSCIQPSTSNFDNLNKIDCQNFVLLGQKKICLPIIEGMTECYDNPIVKQRADELEYAGNIVLAYYINNETYNKLSDLNEIKFDDYFKIYTMAKLKTYSFDLKEFKKMSNLIDQQYVIENWDDILKKIKNTYSGLEFQNPKFIESYSTHENVKTYVMIIPLKSGNNENLVVGTMNMLLLKNRLIYLGYYKNYTGEGSISLTKNRNDMIINNLLEAN